MAMVAIRKAFERDFFSLNLIRGFGDVKIWEFGDVKI